MVITCLYLGLGLLAIAFTAWDTRRPGVMDERHG